MKDYRISESDFLGAARVHEGARARVTSALASWVGATALFALYVSISGDINWYAAPPAVAFFAFMFFVVDPRLRQWLLRRAYARQSEHQEEHRLTFDDDGLAIITKSASVKLTWSRVSGYKESDRLLLLYFDNVSFWVIPKAVFDDHAELESLKSKTKHLVR